ncbi:MAG: cation:proton antiporter [Leptolyngbya sp. SIO1E4]|nr:cation:proton antiporter [Leptolyngbya sp. SIO1E4]
MPQLPLAEVGVIGESVVFSALLISATIIFLTSTVWEEACAWLKLPPVLGQLMGGLLLGVSALKILVFAEGEFAINPGVIELIRQTTATDVTSATIAYTHQLIAISEGAANLGVIALLFFIGLESDFDQLLRVGPQAAMVAGAGVILPFLLGTLGLMTLFEVAPLPAIFSGAALTATSIGITAKVLQELGHLKSKEGQIIIGAAVLDDLLGILILALVVSLVKDGTVDLAGLAYLLLTTVVFVGSVAWLRTPIGQAFEAITGRLRSENSLLIGAIIFALLVAAIANAIHLEAILGAFAAGVVLSGITQREALLEQFQPMVGVLAPVFFIVVGAKTDLSVLSPNNPESLAGLAIAAFLILVAILGKIAAGYLIPHAASVNRLAIGMGMVPRGEVGLVFVGIGASLNILSSALTAAIVLMVIATTFIAPLLLRWTLGSKVVAPSHLIAKSTTDA